jgi:DNA repair exonuclease SbcCD ATPase subunit
LTRNPTRMNIYYPKYLIQIICAFLLLAGRLYAETKDEVAAQLEAARQELSSMESEKKQLETQQSAIDTQYQEALHNTDMYLQAMDQAKAAAGDIQEEISLVNTDLMAANDELSAANAEAQEIEVRLGRLRNQIDSLSWTIYLYLSRADDLEYEAYCVMYSAYIQAEADPCNYMYYYGEAEWHASELNAEAAYYRELASDIEYQRIVLEDQCQPIQAELEVARGKQGACQERVNQLNADLVSLRKTKIDG